MCCRGFGFGRGFGPLGMGWRQRPVRWSFFGGQESVHSLEHHRERLQEELRQVERELEDLKRQEG